MALVLPKPRKSFRLTEYIFETGFFVQSAKKFLLGQLRLYCAEPGDGGGKRGLVLGCYDGDCGEPTFTPTAQKFNENIGGKLKELVKQSGSEIRRAKCRVFNNVDPNFWSIAVVGIGPQKAGYNDLEMIDEDRENVRVAAAVGAKMLAGKGCQCVCMDGMCYPEQAAEGSALGVWRYQEHRSKDKQHNVPNLELFDGQDQDAWQRGLFKAESQNLVRKLCDQPANLMTPLHFAQHTVNELCPCGIKVEVHDKDWIENKKMNSFLTVARGSCAPPLFIEINYCGGPIDQKPIMLVGKGITFDSGGLCLKKCRNMLRHKADMAGGAVVMSAIRAASALSLPINITGLIPLCENMPSGMSMRVGDVVTGMNGKTILVEHTCNEGRMCLADALVYGQMVYKPRLIVDISTESKGITAALGSAATGVFSNSHTMWTELRKAGAVTGDRMWRMPLWKYFTRHVTLSKSIDVQNHGMGKGEACLAAAFLQEFVVCVDWLHLDIHGTGIMCHDNVYPYLTKGRMTGRPTRTIIQFLYQLACPPGPDAGCAK